ncbi:LacI family transcriptional regulator [Deinococcus psychrotolerans]|uniref:LacI family transcriptional regulator n=1 Tax=Deinococcus psychrotolerans TaxID=2489213 RepID=A0A3G8YFQ8_9DEIO|nr:LacI family DNA-binding transcriptional regulator [Deinococcus psychrotolerans]AZI44128.1 LacI family transcriptional regulator [Deinococcus psychrotolerans]
MTRATLRDVAAHAGVSYQTVSNVLNDHPSIRPTTRQRVLDAIRTLDYYPNQAAKALRESRVTTLCCAFYGHSASDISDPYRNLIQSAFVAQSNQSGYDMTTAFLSHGQPQSFQTLKSNFLQQRFAGALVVGSNLTSQEVQMFRDWKMPTVFFDHTVPALDMPSVTADYAQGMVQLVTHLAQQGRRRLALIIPKDDQGSTAAARRESFTQAAEQHGLAHQVVQGDWSYDSGKAAFEALHAGSFAPDAVLAGNDRMAAGALRAAHRLNVDVPGDVTISGFDDFEFALFTAPTLTTVHVPYGEMARKAVELLLTEISPGSSQAVQLSLPTQLIIRESA